MESSPEEDSDEDWSCCKVIAELLEFAPHILTR